MNQRHIDLNVITLVRIGQWKTGKWMKMAGDSTFARWTYAHYFDFVSDKDKKNIIVKCNLCPIPRELSTSRNSTSNLKKYFELCHATTPLTEKRKKTDDESVKPKQQKLSFSRSAIMPLEPREVRSFVAEYVVEDMLPLSMVESPFFRKLVGIIPVTSTIQGWDVTILYLNAFNLSFLFIYCLFWILKIQRLNVFEIENSILYFKYMYLKQLRVNNCRQEEDGEVAFTDLHSVLTGGYDEDAQQGLCVLPAHFVIANSEIDKWLSSNPESRAVYRSSTAKCSALWTKASRSTVASECLEKISERKLIVPSVTRWNSFYGAYVQLIEMPLTDINNLCTQLQIKCMNDREYQFLKVYCSIMKPFTLLAAVSLPKFKLRWVKEETRRDHIKYLLTTECRSLTAEEPATPMIDAPQPAAVTSSCISFQELKKTALRYNAPIPSSAPAERLSSLGSLVLTPKRNRLGDRRFQHLILMLILSMDLYNFCFDLTLS
uniref:BED-type domain-containing protein n=1 Tax=Monopterus albus TaxID=43700 RepID=A0A3Q3JDX1_MONAL